MPNGISFLDKGIIPSISPFPSIGDFNNDGWLEPFGLINDGQGGLLTGPSGAIQSILNNYPDRTPRDVRLLDIDGDSNLDAIWNVYSDPLLQGSFTLILYGDGQGGISRTEERRDIAGFGETIVAADFNNDGTSDVFIPVYTHVYGSDSSFLLFNQSGVLGPNVALEWGVGLGNQPGFLRVEGAQGADVNFDGFIDLYTAGHLFLNDGSQFADALAAAPPFDEGGSLIDFDNDGDFDLALRLENGSVELYEWTGNAFQSHGLLTAGNSFPGFGIKTFDIDGNGWEDIVFGHSLGTSALLNFGGTFQRVDISGVEFYATAFADIDKDGRIDIIGGASTGNMVYLQNQSIVGDSLEIAVLGALGEQDQFGRSVRLSPVDAPSVVMARAVESGSGYLSQSQYNLIVGLPVAGEYRVEVTFANGPLTFSASAGQRVEAFADGHVLIAGSAGNDIFGGGDGADFLLGNAGDDIVRGSHGADIIDAGTGVDVLNYGDLDTSVDIDLSASAAMVSGAQQSISGVEDIVGSAYSDQITGDKAANRIYGGAGDDIIDGLGGVDELNGERGNDIYAVEDASATVIELANEGLDEVRTGLAAYTLPDNVEILTGTSLTGQALTGNDGDNLLSGGPGTDIFSGGLGNDVYLVGPGDQVIEAVGAGIDEIRANGASFALADNVENLVGTNAVGQQLIGNALDNMLSGSTGADLFSGGQGDDSYVVDAGDVIVENAGEGIDQVSTSLLSYALPNNVENVRGTATAGQEFFGNDLSNRLEGGSGPDRFHGGLGDDVYYVSNGDAVFENAAEGIDSVVTSLASYTLIANVENVTGTSNLGQKLVGNSADNIFVSGTGPNTLIGLAGNDSYFVNSQADLVTESPSGGQDTIYAGVNYTLYDGSEVEGLSAADTVGTAPLALEGNYLANTLTGNDGANILDGAGGADKLYGLGGNDVFVIDNAADQVFEADQGGFDTVFTTVNFSLGGGAFVEQLIARDITTTYALNLTGNANANTLIGNDGANILDGAGGADKLYGLGGNDVFVIDNAADQVFEADQGGFDTAYATTDFSLGDEAFVEQLIARDITTTYALNLTGNVNANTLIGNGGANILDGAGGADKLYGLGGNDVFVIDNAADQVFEADQGGFDTVFTTVNFSLGGGAFVEQLIARDITTTYALNLTGNANANTLIGNDGANILDGAGGADKLYGLGGNDVFVIDNAADQVFEADQGGFDTAYATTDFSLGDEAFVEQLIARDITTTYALNLTGNANANTLIGNDGTNVLDGAGGADKLYGLGGNDVFDGGAGNDTLDAGAGDDRIVQTGSTDGRDFVDGGAGTDTYVLTGDAASEAFTIYTRAAFAAAFPTDALNAATEIVVVRNGVVITELDNIEEIRIDTFDVSANDGNGTPNGGSNGGDTITIVGDFTQTSLDYSTIRINGSAGNDTVDISSLTSAHRIIFSSNGGQDVILGDLRPQDIIVEDPSQGDGVASDSVSSWHTNIEADGLQSDWGRVTGALEEFAIPAQYLPVAASSRAHADNPSLAFNTEESIDVSGQGLDQPQALVWPGEHVDTHGWLQFMADHGHAIF